MLRHQIKSKIDKFKIQEITEIDQIYRVLKQAGELKSGHLAAADKSVHAPGTKGLDGSAGLGIGIGAGGAAGAGPPSLALPLQSAAAGERAPPPEIPIVNVPDTGFHLDSHQQQHQQQQQHAHQRSLASVAQAAAVRAGRGVRPPPVAMPILGVQLQQQELQQQRGGLPVPTQDISSSSGPQLIAAK